MRAASRSALEKCILLLLSLRPAVSAPACGSAVWGVARPQPRISSWAIVSRAASGTLSFGLLGLNWTPIYRISESKMRYCCKSWTCKLRKFPQWSGREWRRTVIEFKIECGECGRRYVEDAWKDLQDVIRSLNQTGYCCEYCKQDNEVK